MRLESYVFKDASPKDAALGLVSRIKSSGEHPDFVLIASSYKKAGSVIRETILNELPGCAFVGVSSQFGVFSNDPSTFADIECMSVMIFYDPDGTYAIGSGLFGSDENSELDSEIRRALTSCGRKGEIPDLVYFVFGHILKQQFIIGFFENFFGKSIPIFGGGSGYHGEIAECFTSKSAYIDEDFYAFVLFYPSCRIRTTYSSFYRIMPNKGIISRTEGNRILEIDNRRAIDVYRSWLEDYFPGELLSDSSDVFKELVFTHPLGVPTGLSSRDNNYQTYVVFSATPEGGLKTYTHLRVGTSICLMKPYAHDVMVRKFQNAVECRNDIKNCTRIYGMLTVTCYLIRSSMNSQEVDFLKNLEYPVCGFFSAGEHGQFTNGVNTDSNLMHENIIFCEEEL